MESILSELGAVNENESDVQRNILKERVLNSIRFPKQVGDELVLYEPITVIGGIPELSRKSYQTMLSELQRELRDLELLKGRSILYEIALIKLRVFQGLVDFNGFVNIDVKDAIPDSNVGEQFKRSSVFDAKIEHNANPGRAEANFMTLAQVGKDPGHSISSSTRFSKSGMSGGSNLGLNDINLHIHGKGRESQKWNIDDSMIDGLNSEAINSRSNDNQHDRRVSSSVGSSGVTDVNFEVENETNCNIPEQDNTVSSGECRSVKTGTISSSRVLDKFSSECSANLIEPTSNEKRKLVPNKKEPSDLGYSGDGKASKRVKRKSEKETDYCMESRGRQREPVNLASNEESVTCPICSNDLPLGQLSAAIVLDKHIDRCGRRLQAQIPKDRSASAANDNEDEYEDEAEFSLTYDGDEGISSSRKTPLRATRSRNAVQVESGSESDFEDPNDDFDPESDSDDSNSGSIEDGSEGVPTSRQKTAADKKGGKKAISGKLKGKKMKKDIIRDLVEPSLSKKDIKKADKLLRDAKRGRGFNRKGIIEEDKAEVFDDWEDDFYLDRLAAAGIDDFESAVRLANSKIKKERDSTPLYDEKKDIIEVTDEDEAHLPGVHRGYCNIGDTLDIDKHTWDVLFDYQKEGVQWLYSLYESGVGGILGDEMGLGKTAQLCCHFGSLARKQRKQRKKNGIFLVVCPATVLQHWLKEFHRWVPAVRCVIMHSISKTGAELQQLAESGERHALITFFAV
jgi:SNF2-related domain